MNIEMNLLLLLIAVGAALALSTVLKWLRHQPVSAGGWAAFGAGIHMILAAIVPSMLRRSGDR